MHPRLLVVLLGLGLGLAAAGCPTDDPAKSQSEETPAPDTEDEEATAADPLEGSPFTREQLFAIYRAEQAGGREQDRVWREERLIEGQGQRNEARIEAYERALQAYSGGDPAGWSEFVESLPALPSPPGD
jgi:hypothetical protein